ncbi:MAG: hypothetical protein Q9169_000263 [Polycauliona sp. 2 TL-2023]
MDEREKSPPSRQGPFGYEFPGNQHPPRISGPPLLNPSEDRVLDNFIQGVGSDQGWFDDQLLISTDGPRPHEPAHQMFQQEPLGPTEVGLRDTTAIIHPTSSPFANELPHQFVPRDPSSAFFDMIDYDHQADVTAPDHIDVHPVSDAMNDTASIEYLYQAPTFGTDGQEIWPRHEYSDRSSDAMLGITHPKLNQRCAKENLVQFGSDLRFARDHFEAPDHHQTEARLRATMLGQVQGLFTKGDYGRCHPSSPNVDEPRAQPLVGRTEIVDSPTQALENKGHSSPIQEHFPCSSTKPRGAAAKRSKSAAFTPTVKPATRSRKNKGKRHTNLSNEQRVDNHRQSEQRRRDEIRNSYVAMKATIPGMGDKKTKGAEMQYTVTWMRQTLEENERLLELLESVTKGN